MERDARILTLIGVAKLLKAAALVAIGVGLVKIGHGVKPGSRVEAWLGELHPGMAGRLVDNALRKLLALPPKQRAVLDAGAFLYASLFVVEGVGLLIRKRWAEWFTLVTTGLLIPLECYEIYERPTAVVRYAVLVANVAILIYLAWNLRRTQRSSEEERPGDLSDFA